MLKEAFMDLLKRRLKNLGRFQHVDEVSIGDDKDEAILVRYNGSEFLMFADTERGVMMIEKECGSMGLAAKCACEYGRRRCFRVEYDIVRQVANRAVNACR